MHTPEIQTLLSQFDRLSSTYMQEEVEAALKLQEEITPFLLRIIEDLGENPLRYTLEEHNGHVYAALLLSHFREPAAHVPFIRAFSVAEEQLMDLWGDMTTETLPTLLYQTCGGSIEEIKTLIGNREVDQYVRCAAMEALSYVVAFDTARREEVINFFQGFFTGSEADPDSYFWGNLTATLCDLHPEESLEIIRKAFADGIVRPGFIALEDVERAGSRGREEALASLHAWVISRMPADVHGYISWFSEFHQEDAAAPTFSPASPSPADPNRKPETKKKTGGAKNKPAQKAKKKNRR